MQGTLLADTTLILGANRNFESLDIGINDRQVIHAGTYQLNEVIGRRGDYKFSTTTQDRYFTDASHVGQLTIGKLDKQNRTIEGTFSFEAYNAYTQKTVSVTSGRFRLNYTTN